MLGVAAAAGMPLESLGAPAERMYGLSPFGNVHFLHFTDCHAQLMPTHFREPSMNIGVGEASGKIPHLVGERLLKAAGVPAHSSQAHAFTSLDFEAAASTYGKIGGFAHLTPCCSMAATPGKALPRPCGRAARTWWTPAWPWAWT